MKNKLFKKYSQGRTNIFFKYFVIFAAIFLVSFMILGASIEIMVNAYSLHEKTELLEENTRAVAESISNSFIVDNMNSYYSYDKEQVCESLNMISSCIDSEIIVCDVGGQAIFCKDQVGFNAYRDQSMVCKDHKSFKVDDKYLQRVYEGASVSKILIDGEQYYIVGNPIVSERTYGQFTVSGNIIGSVFAITPAGTSTIVRATLRAFFVVALLCLSIGFVMIWALTKRMVTPLQQMSNAAKSFAVGDFSYRVNIEGNDELSDLGNAFNDMADALDKLESSRRSFVANVSHELKTPMTSIAGFIDGILDGTIPSEKQDYYLKIVSDEIRRLSRLVVAMLNMSKIESGDFRMQPKNYNVSDQIIHILLTFEQKIEKKNIEIRGLEDLEPHHIHADTDMIYQVIYNLFDNAVKFTNENGYIEIKMNDEGNFVKISIKNSGEGINPEELSRIFERFYKVDKSRSLDSKGAGLGLYIVKTMVEMHGGRIYARSDEVSEAEFVFTLPKAE